VCLVPNNATATGTTPGRQSRKSPLLAVLLSLLIPGAGQLYCEKPQRSGPTLAFSILGLIILVTGDEPIRYLGLLIFLILWIFSVFDAYFTAIEVNKVLDSLVDGRNPRVAIALSFFVPGSGYFYLGEHVKGVMVFFGFSLASGCRLPALLLLALWILIVGDAYRIAHKQVKEALEAENRNAPAIRPVPALWIFHPVGAAIYVSFIKATRQIRALKRRVWRRLPRWVADASDLVEYVNFLKLLPLIVGILFAPKHFFEKLPVIIKGNSDPFLSPLKAMTTFASLAVIMSARFGWSLEYK
jgi:TM2 domain-containing membrane protein YozV